MRFEIPKSFPDPDRAKAICREVAKVAKVPTAGLLVHIQKGPRLLRGGCCYGTASKVYRKGDPVQVRGYIKLYLHHTPKPPGFAHNADGSYITPTEYRAKLRMLPWDWDALANTFAHELSHLKDARRIKVPWAREKRAEAFANKVMEQREKLIKKGGKP